MVSLTIDDQKVKVPRGTTILEAARKAGIYIPSLCAMPEIHHTPGACRVCVVEVERSRTLVAACVYPVAQGMKVKTNSKRVRRGRRAVVEFLLSDHPQDCTICAKTGACELQKVAELVGVREIRVPRTDFTTHRIDDSSPALMRDTSKCINCLRCVTVCAEVQGVSLLTPEGRGFDFESGAGHEQKSGRIRLHLLRAVRRGLPHRRHHGKRMPPKKCWPRWKNRTCMWLFRKHRPFEPLWAKIWACRPARWSPGKMIAALRRLGFDKVFDTNFTADLTIIEEGNELLHRVKNGGRLPLITSCSPGWIKFIEHFYPDLLPHISTCKSPQQMFGALAKTYYAQQAGIDPKNIYVVSIMPCTAKKFEAKRPEMNSSGYTDVDAVLTTRELARYDPQSRDRFWRVWRRKTTIRTDGTVQPAPVRFSAPPAG